MRVLHVIAGAKVGGAETFAQDAIVSLHERGVEQMVVTRPWPAPLLRYRQAGVPVRPLPFSLLDRALLRPTLIRRAATAMRADLVHAWMSRANAFIPAAMPMPVLGWFGDYYDLKYFRHADCFAAVTPDIAAYIVRSGMPAGRTFTVNTFGSMPDAAPVSRADLGTPADAMVLLVLSRMHRVKGIDTMLEALAQIPGAVLWLAGDGPEVDAYRALAERLGVAGRVRFLGWRNDRKALLEACDIVVLPSRYEPFGTVIIEAWAARRPLVATLADGARQYVTDGVDGLTCPVDDPAALAERLRRMVASAPLRARLAAAGHAGYLKNFTREIVTDRLIACYETCIRLGKRR